MQTTLKTIGGILSALGTLALNCSLFGDVLGVMVTAMQADDDVDVDGDSDE